jgi:hypothetical protein
MRLIAFVVSAALLAGCGVTPDERVVNPGGPRLDAHVYGPAHASPDVAIPVARPRARPASPAVTAALASGVVGVVDASGRVGVRPRTLETSSDAELRDLRWQRWDAAGARGSGRLRILDCDPSCALGRVRSLAATIRLSAVRECGGRFYFDAAAVRIDPAASPVRGAQPASYVRAPC